jgi:hypothetical protein
MEPTTSTSAMRAPGNGATPTTSRNAIDTAERVVRAPMQVLQ